MKDNCFTVLCWFLPSISMNQPQVYLCPLPLEHPSHCPPLPVLPLQVVTSPSLSSLSHPEQILVIYFTQAMSVSNLLFPYILPSHSTPPVMSVSLFSGWVSIAALHIGASVISFQIPYICISIHYLFFSFRLHSV